MSRSQEGGAGRTARLLLDVRFRARATPSLLPALYLSTLVLIGVAGVSAVVVAAVQAWWLGLVAVVVVTVVGLVLAAAVRIGCELVWAVLELNEYVGGIADRLPHLESVIGDLARDMPKLGFLRRGANGRERAAAAEAEKIV
jgi:hypothetical protein